MSEDRFLGRWSRLKRAGAEAAAGKEGADAVPGTGEASEGVEASGVPPEEPEITQAEIDALPRVEDLMPGDDIRAFLRRGVPRALRQAVLRRAWRLNPAIRDYLDDAREYALDYNAPGGVPGGGPVAPEDVAKLLGTLFGTRPTGGQSASATPAVQTSDAGEERAQEPPREREEVPRIAHDPSDGEVAAPARAEAPRGDAGPEHPRHGPRPRHGGATPV